MIKKFLKIIFVLLFLPNILFAKTEYFQEGLQLYNKNKYEDAKFKFEQDIVFNQKMNYHIYIYLKYLKNLKKDLEEQNLNTVILLNPKNEEAIYYLAKLKLDSSDYKESKILMKDLKPFVIFL